MLAVLQTKWRAAREKAMAFDRDMERQYGACKFGIYYGAPRGKRERREALWAKVEVAADAIFAWLDEHSPRSWRSGVPAYWICDSLTEADALTSGQLQVIPPPGYGSFPSDSVRFAMPVREEVAAGW